MSVVIKPADAMVHPMSAPNVDPQAVGRMRLDDILFHMEEPERTRYLRLWVDADHFGDGRVLIKPASGKPMVVRLHGQEFAFTAQGRRLPRRLAIELLLNFGEQGLYRGRDQATGFTRLQWTTLKPEVKALYDPEKLYFLEDYLTHVPDGDTDGDGDAGADGRPAKR